MKPEILCIVTTMHLATNLCNKAKIRPRVTAAAAAAAAVVVAAAVAAAVAVAAVKRIPTAQAAVAAAAAAAVVKKLQNPTEESHEPIKKSAMTPAVLQMRADLRIQDLEDH